uniref:Uncharacterized protein n=1 Tax=Siphoviridae sp. ctGN02 TaxID=2825411 RepID=A0A8S5PJ58_9CAUD|nr:MAG TPA: hypothetical protein [Siphoviridae sp. ctGN02]
MSGCIEGNKTNCFHFGNNSKIPTLVINKL